jgi:hypothetical protein
MQQAAAKPDPLDVPSHIKDSLRRAPHGRIEKRHPYGFNRLPGAYHQDMRFLEAIATAFFRTFGITQPSEQRLRRAAWFLFGLLTLIVVSIGTVCIILFHSM